MHIDSTAIDRIGSDVDVHAVDHHVVRRDLRQVERALVGVGVEMPGERFAVGGEAHGFAVVDVDRFGGSGQVDLALGGDGAGGAAEIGAGAAGCRGLGDAREQADETPMVSRRADARLKFNMMWFPFVVVSQQACCRWKPVYKPGADENMTRSLQENDKQGASTACKCIVVVIQ